MAAALGPRDARDSERGGLPAGWGGSTADLLLVLLGGLYRLFPGTVDVRRVWVGPKQARLCSCSRGALSNPPFQLGQGAAPGAR